MARTSASMAKKETGSRSAADSRSHEEKASAQQPETSVHPVEPEDARVTGTSRSLQRRVLGLNVEGNQGQPHPETTAGQHATGSFTGKQDRGKKG